MSTQVGNQLMSWIKEGMEQSDAVQNESVYNAFPMKCKTPSPCVDPCIKVLPPSSPVMTQSPFRLPDPLKEMFYDCWHAEEKFEETINGL